VSELIYALRIQLTPLGRSCLYPLMKRITYWPQGWLGIAINFGAVVSWLTVTADMDYVLMASLLFSMWSWTILYGERTNYIFRLTAYDFYLRHHIRLPGQG
jgi:4-hydroxybenzoate polyprenyltransferase